MSVPIESHDFYDYYLHRNDDKLYFQPLEDIEEEGNFNCKDKFHYYYLGLGVEVPEVVESYPLAIFTCKSFQVYWAGFNDHTERPAN